MYSPGWFKLVIFLPLPPEGWDYRCVPPHGASHTPQEHVVSLEVLKQHYKWVTPVEEKKRVVWEE
jgi:hypothetical protein